MYRFGRRPSLEERQISDHLADVVRRLDVLTAALEAHCLITLDHGRRLDLLPESVVSRAIVEAREAAQLAMSAAWLSIRRKIFEELSKWAWRAILGFLGIKLLAYAHTMATNLSIPTVTP